MENPYYDFVTRHGLAGNKTCKYGMQDFGPIDVGALLADPLSVKIGITEDDCYPLGRDLKLSAGITSMHVRRLLVKYFAWAVPSPDVIAAIAEYGPVVEMAAGVGYWAKMLRGAGCNVTALDAYPGNIQTIHPNRPGFWSPVFEGNFVALAAGDYDDRTLLLVWPPYNTPCAYDAVRSWGGTNLVHVGEGPGGCTGDDDFHNYVEENFDEVKDLPVPQFYGVRDYAFFYRRKGNRGAP